MHEKSNRRRLIDFHQDRLTQISESHCGPAVIQMLLNYLGIEVSQQAVAEAGGATDLIELQGMRVDQLGRAAQRLAPHTSFWYKDHSTLEELVRIVTNYNYLVGIEWQGVFEDTLEEETQEGDYGHYSVVSTVDPINRKLVIVDPYKDFRAQDRIFTFEFFITRWWDTNEVADPITGEERIIEDRQMMFTITPQFARFPRYLGMTKLH